MEIYFILLYFQVDARSGIQVCNCDGVVNSRAYLGDGFGAELLRVGGIGGGVHNVRRFGELTCWNLRSVMFGG